VRYQYPDILAGLPTADELQDVHAATSVVPAGRTGALAAIEAKVAEAGPGTVETVEEPVIDEPEERV
jgi:hypothetical protein